MLRNLLTETRYGLRALLAKPSFTLIAVLTLALGIGANTAVYTLFEQLVTRPLPVPAPEQLVNLASPGPKWGTTSSGGAGARDEVFSYSMSRDLQAQQTSFTGIAAHRSLDINLAYRGQTQPGHAMLVSPEYFPVLQLQPALGRLLGLPDQGAIGEPRIAVLSHAYWQTHLGGSRDVLGQPIKVNGQTLTIVGVAPRGFEGTTIGSHPQVFVPLSLRWLLSPQTPADADDRLSYWVYLYARLKPGVSIETAATEINRVYSRIIQDVEAPLQKGQDALSLAQFKAKQIELSPGAHGQSTLSRQAAGPMMLLLGVAALVLLIACLNTANLLLARQSARAGELAIRSSLGASRAQLLRQQLLESLMLATLGGLCSLPIAVLCVRALLAVMPADAASTIDASLNASALRFSMLAALSTVLIFGLFPALHAARAAPMRSLKNTSNQTGGGRVASRFRTLLATAQIALSMASLALAGLFIQSLNNLSRADLGMQVESLATFAISPARNGYDAVGRAQLYDRLEVELAALPGVTAVTTSMVPLLTDNNWGSDVSVEGLAAEVPSDNAPLYNEIGSAYFQTLDIPLLTGRDFTPADAQGRPRVAIVNRRFAETFGLGMAAVGKRMALGQTQQLNIEIIGIVENSRYDSVKNDPPAQFFLPRRQNDAIETLTYYVRSAVPPERLLSSLTGVLARLDPDLPIENLSTLPQQIRENLVMDRLVGLLSSAFALLATLLAAGGVYGVLAYTLSQRTREIGLRLALGAAPARIRVSLLAEVGRMFLIGGAIGLLLALALGRSAQALLFELDAHDPGVLSGAAVILAAVALFAGWWPARRAARIDPMVALRWE